MGGGGVWLLLMAKNEKKKMEAAMVGFAVLLHLIEV